MRLIAALALLLAPACSEYEINSKPDDVGGREDDVPGPGEDDGDAGDAPDADAAITGAICDPAGTGMVVGATVYTIADLDGDGTAETRVEDTTDGDGAFTLSGLPLGTYTVYVEKGSFSTSFEITLDEEGVTELPYEECLDPGSVDIAVVTGEYDSIEDVLDRLGLDYTKYRGTASGDYLDLMRNADEMAKYDIIFLNCGVAETWLTYEAEVARNIQGFVRNGGSLYASDWAWYFVEVAFPDAIDFYGDDSSYYAPMWGRSGRLTAKVVDLNMQVVLGSVTADLNYDLDAWVVPVGVGTGAGATVLVAGDPSLYFGGSVDDAPLAVVVDEDDGRVIFTSFHNETQTTLDMDRLLEEIILSL